jgi:hypothetical protein
MNERTATILTLPSVFKLVFLCMIGLTLLSLAVTLFLLIRFNAPSEDVKRFIETCSTTWKMGFGAVVGLFGGKALS